MTEIVKMTGRALALDQPADPVVIDKALAPLVRPLAIARKFGDDPPLLHGSRIGEAAHGNA
jgi:hypothetical protein